MGPGAPFSRVGNHWRNKFFSKINSLTPSRSLGLFTIADLKSKLADSNLVIEKLESKYFGRFFQHKDIGEKSNNCLNKSLAICFGEVYLILAKKKLMPVTPLRKLFGREKKVIKSKILET